MSEFESYNRAAGPTFDSRYVLAPTSIYLTTYGEQDQTLAERYKAFGISMNPSGFVETVVQAIATMPMDAKALGLACAAATAVTLFHAGRAHRDIAIENSIIVAGLPKEAAVESRGKQIWKRTKSTLYAAGAGYAAYKVGVPLSQTADVAASLGTIAVGAGYVRHQQRRYR